MFTITAAAQYLGSFDRGEESSNEQRVIAFSGWGSRLEDSRPGALGFIEISGPAQ
jgi:hypothetical protein